MEIWGKSLLVSGNSKSKDHGREEELGDSEEQIAGRPGWEPWWISFLEEGMAELIPQRTYSETVDRAQ